PAAPNPPGQTTPSPEVQAALQRIDGATFPAEPVAPDAVSPHLLKAQVWLARQRFSPGVIDGKNGTNLRQALEAWQEERGLTADGQLTQAVWSRLQQESGASAVTRYVITAQDVAGPFTAAIPEDLPQQAQLQALGYRSAAEALAERFQMDEGLLRALNPQVDFTRAGQEIVVAAVSAAPIGEVAKLEIDKDRNSVRALDAEGKLIAYFPATIGSQSQPSPSGRMTVNGVARNPTYTYDPARLDYAAEKISEKLVVPAGPNNPVGAVWIDLSRETYGIHGTPEPEKIGKTASNGCVRLTNWDALALADAVKAGVEVVFV
ncbi:MAG TPA: L,D-transpeptidase, partial [Caulobacteraceae bacterium]